MKITIFAAIAIISLPAAAQTTNCYTYGNNTSCITNPSYQPSYPSNQTVNPNGCGSSATCTLNGLLKAREQQQELLIQQERLEQLRLQNEQLRMQNQSMQNQAETNEPQQPNERPNDTEIKASYCLGALSDSGHSLETQLFKNYLSKSYVTTVGKTILDASMRQGEVDRNWAMGHQTQCITQCSQDGKSIESCSLKCQAQYANEETERKISSCQGASFLPH